MVGVSPSFESAIAIRSSPCVLVIVIARVRARDVQRSAIWFMITHMSLVALKEASHLIKNLRCYF